MQAVNVASLPNDFCGLGVDTSSSVGTVVNVHILPISDWRWSCIGVYAKSPQRFDVGIFEDQFVVDDFSGLVVDDQERVLGSVFGC